MSIGGHVSRAMLSRYSHVRMEAKRRALDEIAARRRAAGEKRENAQRQERVAAACQPAGGSVINNHPARQKTWLGYGPKYNDSIPFLPPSLEYTDISEISVI